MLRTGRIRDKHPVVFKAKGTGVYQGGKRRLDRDRDRIRAMHASGSAVAAIASALGCLQMQVYRVLNEGRLLDCR